MDDLQSDPQAPIFFRAAGFKVIEENGSKIYLALSIDELRAEVPSLAEDFNVAGDCRTEFDTWGNARCARDPLNPCRDGGECRLQGNHPIFWCQCVARN